MISSSKRVIKRPDAAALVEQYILPLELTLAGGEAATKKAVFPRYSEDGTEKGEYIHVPRNRKLEKSQKRIKNFGLLRKGWIPVMIRMRPFGNNGTRKQNKR